MINLCEKWLIDILASEGIYLTPSNQRAVGRGIRRALGIDIELGVCQEDWRMIRNRVSKDPMVRSELITMIREEIDKEK
ncbi:MAG: hypothetical protein GX369_00030 [Euryarchaeota archaeon]|nr:hypothetical protein [Euryarchaeota archaeon]